MMIEGGRVEAAKSIGRRAESKDSGSRLEERGSRPEEKD
jgi:hypothetical protein